MYIALAVGSESALLESKLRTRVSLCGQQFACAWAVSVWQSMSSLNLACSVPDKSAWVAWETRAQFSAHARFTCDDIALI